MALHLTTTTDGRAALDDLRRVVLGAKGSDPLAPVTVVVPTNAAGVLARRALGRAGGIAAVQFLTAYRLAELLGGPALAAAGRRPVSTPVVSAAVQRVLVESPGRFAPVHEHETTVAAALRGYRELRGLDPGVLRRLGTHGTPLAAELVRVHDQVRRRLVTDWYDEADLLDAAGTAIEHGAGSALGTVVLHLPIRPSGAAAGGHHPGPRRARHQRRSGGRPGGGASRRRARRHPAPGGPVRHRPRRTGEHVRRRRRGTRRGASGHRRRPAGHPPRTGGPPVDHGRALSAVGRRAAGGGGHRLERAEPHRVGRAPRRAHAAGPPGRRSLRSAPPRPVRVAGQRPHPRPQRAAGPRGRVGADRPHGRRRAGRRVGAAPRRVRGASACRLRRSVGRRRRGGGRPDGARCRPGRPAGRLRGVVAPRTGVSHRSPAVARLGSVVPPPARRPPRRGRRPGPLACRRAFGVRAGGIRPRPARRPRRARPTRRSGHVRGCAHRRARRRAAPIGPHRGRRARRFPHERHRSRHRTHDRGGPRRGHVPGPAPRGPAAHRQRSAARRGRIAGRRRPARGATAGPARRPAVRAGISAGRACGPRLGGSPS